MRTTSLEAFNIPRSVLDLWTTAGHADLLPIQELAITQGRLLQGGNVVVSAPTSAGKTFIGEMASIRAALQNQRVFYLVPQKALADEKFHDFTARFQPLGLTTVVSTRDHHEHDRDIIEGRFHVAITVFEKLAALLVASPGLLSQVGLVVVDELQLIGDPERGPALELLLTKIQLAESRPQIVALSAVLGNAHHLAEWFQAALVTTNRRPIDLRKGVLWNGTFRFIEHNLGTAGEEVLTPPDAEDPLVAVLQTVATQHENVIIFCLSRMDSILTARFLATAMPLRPALQALEELANLEDCTGNDLLRETLQAGIAFHNADLNREQRALIERGIRSGEIRIVCATSTLAMGLNFPVRNVIVCPQRWCRDAMGSWVTVPISQAEYENMAGRAGRLGFGDAFGRAILIADNEIDATAYHRLFIQGSLGEISPTLGQVDLDRHVLNLIASRLCRTTEQITTTLLRSLTGRREWSQDAEGFGTRVAQAVAICHQGGLIREHLGCWQVTELGQLTATKGITVQSAITMTTFARCHGDEATEVSPIEWLWCLSGTPDGASTHVSLTRREQQEQRYDRAILDAFRQAPAWERRHLLETEGFPPRTMDEHRQAKKALILKAWTEGVPTRVIEKTFHTLAGALHALGTEFSWLADAFAGILALHDWPDAVVSRCRTWVEQLSFGVPADGLALASMEVPGLGRGRILNLLAQHISSWESFEQAEPHLLDRILTKTIHARVRERLAMHQPARAQTSQVATPAQPPPEVVTQTAVILVIDAKPQGRRYTLRVQGQSLAITRCNMLTLARLVVALVVDSGRWVPSQELGGHRLCHQAIRRLKQALPMIADCIVASGEKS